MRKNLLFFRIYFLKIEKTEEREIACARTFSPRSLWEHLSDLNM